ncbi:uncharacterized protein LOC109852254 [Pseudomyrmex gracilis]|uniref:uncharacterized protein LOC109852254 n=1 Tax=Pseudomyrmex gracilis TaxID=219809 RepID=UPI000994DA95|nr:uncharacterized protein LOC109852254 [Pseudomyrmex gracilis]
MASTVLLQLEGFPLMLLEIAAENLFVPRTSTFDEITLKKTKIMFRILDYEWISLLPNQSDRHSHRGNSEQLEKFCSGASVVFPVPANFHEKEASGVDVQLCVHKETSEYFKMDRFHKVGFITVPVDDLLNDIARQLRERNKWAEHLSDFYNQQIISRSTSGTYTLLDGDFQETKATISLRIRISYLDKCVMTEIISSEIISKPSESCMQLENEVVEQEDGNENKDEGAYS